MIHMFLTLVKKKIREEQVVTSILHPSQQLR